MPHLTAAKVKNAKPRDKRYKIFDGAGLYLEIAPSGGKWWRLRYQQGGKERRMSLGTFPAVSLAEARRRRDKARAEIIQGVDPLAKKAANNRASGETFEAVARDWYSVASRDKGEKYYLNITRLEHYIFPALGARPIAEIDARDLLDELRKIADLGFLETAQKTRRICNQVFRHALAMRLVKSNPASDLAGLLPTPQVHHHPAVTEPQALGVMLRTIWDYEGVGIMVREALRSLPYLLVRPGNLVKMRWSELDLDEATWSIPGERMKSGEDHLVPLPRQVVEIITALVPLSGRWEWVFAGRSPKRPLSANTLNSALRTLGIDTKEQQNSHGFRATARTLLDEKLGFRVDIIEHQLAHAVKDPTGRAYNRTTFLQQRREMMQEWADYLDSLRNS